MYSMDQHVILPWLLSLGQPKPLECQWRTIEKQEMRGLSLPPPLTAPPELGRAVCGAVRSPAMSTASEELQTG